MVSYMCDKTALNSHRCRWYLFCEKKCYKGAVIIYERVYVYFDGVGSGNHSTFLGGASQKKRRS